MESSPFVPVVAPPLVGPTKLTGLVALGQAMRSQTRAGSATRPTASAPRPRIFVGRFEVDQRVRCMRPLVGKPLNRSDCSTTWENYP